MSMRVREKQKPQTTLTMQPLADSPRFTQEAQLIEEARSGEASGLVEYLYLDILPWRARKLARLFRETCGATLDAEDIQQAGVECALRSLGRALLMQNPLSFLIHAAQLAMLHYCQEQRGPIRVPHVSQWRGARVPTVKSLDAVIPGTDELTLAEILAGEACHV